MNRLCRLTVLVVCSALVFACRILPARAEAHEQGPRTFSRQVSFELTFASRDLLWQGDPGSPTALAYVKPGAQPVATDVQVTKLTESSESPYRRYMTESRIAAGSPTRTVYAFTKLREKVIGTIDEQGHFAPNEFYKTGRELLPSWPVDTSVLHYDAKKNALYYDVELPSPQVTETLDFLPLDLFDARGNRVTGQFSINYAPASNAEGAGKAPTVSLNFKDGGKTFVLAKATVPKVLRRENVRLGSFDNKSGAYLAEADYRAGANVQGDAQPSATFAIAGEFTSAIKRDGDSLVLVDAAPPADRYSATPAKIAVDGNFDDWRNIAGVDDPRGDIVPYLEYSPDVDLLEFKVSHDDTHIYLYARVAGRVGCSRPHGGRSYFYAYMDVDRDPGTGFLPTRDDDCYYGVDIGDDCEVQFEFVDNIFRKTFYGFCGKGGDDNILKQIVTLGKSQYGRLDDNGHERADYKSEYIYRNGVTEITEDLKLGTSDTIQLAVSPDGREVEIASTLAGFLKDGTGRPTLGLGQTIDLAVGMECDGKADTAKGRWSADNTIAIRGYQLRPASPRRD